MSVKALLATLSGGKFHSDEQLIVSLGITDEELGALVIELEQLGIVVKSDGHRGCQLEQEIGLLSKGAIGDSLTAESAALITELAVLDITDSTNVQAMAAAQKGKTGFVCTAELQTAGRGRRGRAWASPYGSNIYLSVAWEFDGGASALEGLSLAVGVAVADALAVAGVEGVELKWPNDVLHCRRKLAGILVEVTGSMEGPCYVVVGIGLNVNMPVSAVAAIDQPWIDLRSIVGAQVERNHLLGLLLNELMPLLQGYESGGFSVYRDRWQALDAFAGQPVNIMYGQQRVAGTAMGVDDSGAIVLQTEGGVREFNGGEVSLRGVDQ